MLAVVWTYIHFASDTSVYARVRHEPLFVCDVEETTMRNTRLCGRRWELPRIDVCVKMNHRNGPIDSVQRTKNGENDRVVPAKASAAISKGLNGAEERRCT